VRCCFGAYLGDKTLDLGTAAPKSGMAAPIFETAALEGGEAAPKIPYKPLIFYGIFVKDSL
jgi:hypothetical protein